MEQYLDKIFYAIIGIAGFVVAFGLAVFIHELGHFLAAKLFKVPVERFVIGFDKEAMPGMPKCIWERKLGETTYGLSLMPLGGYVKMTGTVHPEIEAYLDGEPEQKKEVPREEEKSEFVDTGVVSANVPDEKRASLSEQAVLDQTALYQKPLYQKVIIYGAGVFMNLVLAGFVIGGQAIAGETTNAPLPAVVGWQAQDSVLAEEYGIQQGDVVTELRGEPLETNVDFRGLLYPDPMTPGVTEEIPLTWTRDGEVMSAEVEVEWPEEDAEELNPALLELATLIPYPAYIEQIIPNKPAHKAGIDIGDLILEIDGEPIDDFNELRYIVSRSPAEPLDFTIQRAEEIKEFRITPVMAVDDSESGRIGIIPGNPEKSVEKMDVGEAVVKSPVLVAQYTGRYVSHLKMLGGKLITGDIARVREDLGGPVAIAQMAGIAANQGIERFLRFLIVLNIALAVMNILPLPVLDGGHIVMATWEATFGKPIPPRVLVPVLNGAVVLLLGFVALVTISDLFKIFG